MSKVLIYSTHNYTTSIARCLTTLSVDIIEAWDKKNFNALIDQQEFDLILLDSSSESNIFELVKELHQNKLNLSAAILYLVPGKITYHGLEVSELSPPVIGISKPFSPSALKNLGRILLNYRTQQNNLKKSMAEIEQFAIMAAHDLRTPLKNIFSYADLLKTEVGELNCESEDIEEFSGVIYKETEKMLSFVSDIFEYTRAGSVKLNKEVINLNKFFTDLIGVIGKNYPEKKIEFELFNLPNDYYSDLSKISHIFQNLIDNAVKYSGKEEIKLDIRYFQSRQYEGVFSIKDNGPGIKSEDLDKIFEPFKRVDIEQPGTGMGLAIVKKLVHLLQGEIKVESIPGNGTEFFITMKTNEHKEIA